MTTPSTLAKHMVDYWDSAAANGMVPKATAATLITSCRHVLGVDPGWETLDVRTLDVDECIRKFKNLGEGRYKPRSLQDYGSRFRRAVSSYLSYVEDPVKWRFASSGRRSPKRSDDSVAANRRSTHQDDHGDEAAKEPHGVTLHEYEFPIRVDFMARLAVPRDVTTTEINRLVAWARTLAVDYEPSQ